jgi:hypothetical protein
MTELRAEAGVPHCLALEGRGQRLRGWIDGALIFDLKDDDQPLTDGAMALICEAGSLSSEAVRIQPAGPIPGEEKGR